MIGVQHYKERKGEEEKLKKPEEEQPNNDKKPLAITDGKVEKPVKPPPTAPAEKQPVDPAAVLDHPNTSPRPAKQKKKGNIITRFFKKKFGEDKDKDPKASISRQRSTKF